MDCHCCGNLLINHNLTLRKHFFYPRSYNVKISCTIAIHNCKIRGQHKGLEKLMDSLKDYIGDKKAYLAIMNGDGTRYLDVIRARIKEMFPQCDVVVDKQITATMAIHTGPGLIGVGVLFD